jgi:hypothetical protein
MRKTENIRDIRATSWCKVDLHKLTVTQGGEEIPPSSCNSQEPAYGF